MHSRPGRCVDPDAQQDKTVGAIVVQRSIDLARFAELQARTHRHIDDLQNISTHNDIYGDSTTLPASLSA